MTRPGLRARTLISILPRRRARTDASGSRRRTCCHRPTSPREGSDSIAAGSGYGTSRQRRGGRSAGRYGRSSRAWSAIEHPDRLAVRAPRQRLVAGKSARNDGGRASCERVLVELSFGSRTIITVESGGHDERARTTPSGVTPRAVPRKILDEHTSRPAGFVSDEDDVLAVRHPSRAAVDAAESRDPSGIERRVTRRRRSAQAQTRAVADADQDPLAVG